VLNKKAASHLSHAGEVLRCGDLTPEKLGWLSRLWLSTLRSEGISTLTPCCISASLTGTLNQFLAYQWATSWRKQVDTREQ